MLISPIKTNLITPDVPSTADDSGVAGDIAYDSDYLYICIDTDTWKRVAISTWVVAEEYVLTEDGGFLLNEDGDKVIKE